VAHPVHKFAQARTSLGGQGVAGMPRIVEVDADEPGHFERRAPYAREVAAAELGTLRTDKDKALGNGASELVQVLSDIGQQDGPDGNPADTGQRFGRPGPADAAKSSITAVTSTGSR
jgi:hypothetical protein